MMKLFAFLVLLGVTLASHSFSVHNIATSPAFLWTNNNLKSKYENTQSIFDAEHLLKNLDDNQQEITIIFTENNLETSKIAQMSSAYEFNTNGGALHTLKSLVESAPSAQTYPYLRGARAAISQFSENHKNVHVVTDLDKLNAAVTPLLNNHQQDYVVVALPRNEEGGASIVARTEEMLRQVPHSIVYLGLVDEDQVRFSHTAPAHLSKAMSATTQRYAASQGNSYITPDILTGLLIAGIPILMILWVGVSCTFGLQSALKFDAEKDMLKKNK